MEESNYYPFGLKHKGYNNVVSSNGNSTGNKFKTFQGQEINEELGLNWLSFKYRNYDPSLARFHNVDPLAEEYNYQSPYNFAENRVIDGNELEGLEWERFKTAAKQFFQGANDLAANTTVGEASRQVKASTITDAQQMKEIKQEGVSNTQKSLVSMSEAVIDGAKATPGLVGDGLEVTGDGVTYIGIATAQPEIIAVGEGIGAVGTGINVAVDLAEGKSVGDIAKERLPTIIIGKLGKTATDAIRKTAGSEAVKKGATRVSETIIKAHEKVYEKITTTIIDPKK